MEINQYSTVPPGDPHLIDKIVNQIKSQGTFDQWRRECLADVDTKPAYQNLTLRVDTAVTSFLSKQRWRPELVKNQVRENLRKHILELGFIEKGVDRIVEQVVQPKVGPLFRPAVESAIYSFLGIKKPEVKKEEEKLKNKVNVFDASDVQNDTRKAFKPMPVSIPLHPEDDTPPPGDDQFDLEAITPSPDSVYNRRRNKSRSDVEDIHDDVSDVSMEDVSNQVPVPPKTPTEGGDLEPLERICSPISQTSSADRSSNEKTGNRLKPRPGSALSAISSGEDIPSSAGSPVTSPEEAAAAASPLPVDSEDDDSDDSSDEFSSPEFEKLDVIPLSHSVGGIDLEDSDSKLVPPGEEVFEEDAKDDQEACKQTVDGTRSDRKPDEDEGDAGSRTQGTSTSASATVTQPQITESHPSHETSPSTTTRATDADVVQEVVDHNNQPPAPEATEVQKSVEKSERSSDSRSRSKTDSHRSDRRDKSSSSSSRKDKKRSDRDRDRDRDRGRDKDKERSQDKDRERSRSERHHSDSKSEHKSSKHKSDRDRSDREKSKKSSSHKSDRDRSKERHRDRDRERDRERDRDRKHRDSERSERKTESRKSESSKSGTSSKPTDATGESSALNPNHPKAHLWKRPTEKPKLWEYLAKFPEEVFDDPCSGDYLSDVSISSVSSYDDSDYEEVTNIHLSEVEIDSEVEEAIIMSGGRVIDLSTLANDAAMKSEAEDKGDGGDNKRVRKLNTRYNDSYVGSEWRKMESIITNNPTPTGPLPVRLALNNNPGKRKADDFDSSVSGSSPDDGESLSHDVVMPSTAKKLKIGHEPPSSPESVRSNELPMCDADTLVDPSKDDAKNISPVGPSPRPGRRSNG